MLLTIECNTYYKKCNVSRYKRITHKTHTNNYRSKKYNKYKRNTRSCAETHSGRYGSPAPSSISLQLSPPFHSAAANAEIRSTKDSKKHSGTHIAQHFTVGLVPNYSYFFSQMRYFHLSFHLSSPTVKCWAMCVPECFLLSFVLRISAFAAVE